MAESADEKKVDWKKVVATFETFAAASGKAGTLNSKACGKLVTDCLDKKYTCKGFNIKNIVDASVFSKFKNSMAVNEDNAKKFVQFTALEIANKDRPTKSKLKGGDSELAPIEKEVALLIQDGKPAIKATATSKTGNVSGMTDTSKYTGAHKERFDESGKGKGIDGRVEKSNTSGYVGNYKNEGTYGKK